MWANKFNGSFFFLVFSSITALIIVLSITAKVLPLFTAKVIYFCQQLAVNTLSKVPLSLPNIVLFTSGFIFFVGILSFLLQIYRTRSLLKRYTTKIVSIPKRVRKIILTLDLTNKVIVVKDINLFSFCSGIFSPRIIMTTGLIASLTNKELEAVFLHEKAHLRNYDPLKLLFGKTISSLFFFLPIFSELSKNMVATSEILADSFTITTQKETTFLRGAMKKILATPQVRFATFPAISNPSHLEMRIRSLVDPTQKHSFRLSARSIVTSFIFVLISWFLLQTPVKAFSMQNSMEGTSYFMCSSDNACSQQCAQKAQMSPVSSPEQLFSSQEPKYVMPFYK